MPSTSQQMEMFVRDALARGLSREAIEKALTQAGWTPPQIRDALGAFAEVDFPVPVPRSRPYLSAREAFLYLVLFTTLYLSAYHVGSLCFDFINRAFPDPAQVNERIGLFDSMRWSISSLTIAFPTFLLLSWLVGGDLRRNPAKRASAIRRWLTYLTIFVATGVLIGDLTTLVYNVLGGELSVRFALKVIVVALIAVTVFGYYLWDLRGEERE